MFATATHSRVRLGYQLVILITESIKTHQKTMGKTNSSLQKNYLKGSHAAALRRRAPAGHTKAVLRGGQVIFQQK